MTQTLNYQTVQPTEGTYQDCSGDDASQTLKVHGKTKSGKKKEKMQVSVLQFSLKNTTEILVTRLTEL